MAQLGIDVGSFAQSLAKIELRRQEIRDAASVAHIQSQYNELQYQHEKLATETDFDDQAEFDAFRKSYVTDMERQEGNLLKGQNSRVAARLGTNFDVKRIAGRQNIDTILHRQERDLHRNQAPAEIARAFEQHYSTDTPSEAMLEADLDILMAGYEGWFAEGELEKIVVGQHAEVLGRFGKTEEAKKLVQDSRVLSATEKTAIESRVKAMASVNSDMASKELSAELLRGELTTESVARRAHMLSASDAKAWSQIVVNQRSEGNPVLAAELANQATGIWKGTTTIKELELDARNAMTVDDGINGGEYKQIMGAASSELKQSQAQALTLSYSRGKQQLVTYSEDDVFARILEGKELSVQDLFRDRRKIEFWHLARYDDEMREWLQNNPEKTGTEFSQQAEALLYEYLNRTDAEVDQLQVDRQKQLKNARVPLRPEDFPTASVEQIVDVITGR
ncbi:MAG: hypothetical protein GY832_11540 [Chloroflexi bacterium]|nr:hypothetical protein [Chloroflexota bacterium]